MIKASKFAIAIAAVASLAIATTKVSSAAPIAAGAITVKAPATTESRVSRIFQRRLRSVCLSSRLHLPRLHVLVPHLLGNWAYPGDYYNWW